MGVGGFDDDKMIRHLRHLMQPEIEQLELIKKSKTIVNHSVGFPPGNIASLASRKDSAAERNQCVQPGKFKTVKICCAGFKRQPDSPLDTVLRDP